MPRLLLAALSLLLGIGPAFAQTTDDDGTRLLRFPDIHEEQVVFTYAGDLWLAPANGEGGTARRLTSHPGLELFAKFSPDGRWIAFTGQYDGDEQVYVVPAAGGVPRQLTFYPARGPLPPRWGVDNQVLGWTPDGRRILFRSLRDSWGTADSRLFTVALDPDGLPQALPIPRSGGAAISRDGRRVVYSPHTRDFRNWKRYQGGWAQDLYVYDLEAGTNRRLTHHVRSDRDPMWIGDTLYFLSDRDGTFNIYVRTAEGDRRLTDAAQWDIRWPSTDRRGRVVYEQNGRLGVYETATGASRLLTIRVPAESLARRRERIRVSRHIESFGLAPLGQRALFTARGDVFTAPVEDGVTRNLTRSPGAHDREAVWSHDGRWIYFVSDLSGEEELYRIDQAGLGSSEPLTRLAENGIRGRFSGLRIAPGDGSLAFHDQRGRLFVLDLRGAVQAAGSGQNLELPDGGLDGGVTRVADDSAARGIEYAWSPDGGSLAYTVAGRNGLRSIYVWNAADWTSRPMTSPLWNDTSPAWDEDGDYLFFLSDRPSAAQVDGREPTYVLNRTTAVFALALRNDVPHPFPPLNDEVPLEKAPKQPPPGPVTIDFQGLEERLVRLPIEADNYTFLAASNGYLVLVRRAASYVGREREATDSLLFFSRAQRRLVEVASGVEGLALSPDRSRLLLRVGGNNYQARNVATGGVNAWMVSTAGLVMERDPAAEWRQIFDEVHRRYRDFFYDENLHGFDWQAIGQRYRPLLAHVAHRSDLTWVLSEMIAELEVSHAYLDGGDDDAPPRPRPALLGARFELDREAGRYRIARLLRGRNEEPRYRSPLTEIGVGVRAGDYVLAIGGVELRGGDNPYRLLRYAGLGTLELVVNDSPRTEEARRVLVRPIADESPLTYLEWFETNRREVDELSGGRLGYVHLPDMGAQGLGQWVRWFYGQLDKEGLVIDVRSNGGGHVSEMILDRLRRGLLALRFGRNTEVPQSYPEVVFNGHLVCLINEDTASDAEQFAWAFREAGLGPLVGTRSWGGTVGLFPREPLIDGGRVGVPEMAFAAPDGTWVIEGRGVEPDVEVPPTAAGRDPQLRRAVEVLLGLADAEPRTLPGRPQGPVKAQR